MPKGRPKPGAPGSGQGPGTPPDPNAPTLQAWADNKGEHGQLIVLLMEPMEGGKLPNNPFILSRTIKEAVGSIDSAYRDQNKNLVIRVRSEKKAKKLQEVTELIDRTTQVKVTEHPKLNRSRCIVTCHSVSELTDKELEEELEEQGVIGVHRFSKKGVKTNTMVVTVRGTVPPKEIAFGYEVCRTRPYKDSPMQCFRCFSFGHTKAKCASKNETCRNCSEEHTIKKDDETNKTICDKPTKCKNCNGNHSPAARTCPRYLEEEKILEIRAKNDVSPREARRLYEEEKAAASSSYATIAKASIQQQEADLKSRFQKQESQLRAEMKRELDAARKEIAQQFEKQIQEMQTDHDLTKMALNLARQELHRIRSQTEDDSSRKRKASESGSRSDDSDGSKDQASDVSQNGERTEMLRHPDEIPFVQQIRPDGTTVQPMAHVFSDGHVIAYPSLPKDTEENTNNNNTNNETNNNNNNDDNNNNNNDNNNNNNKSKNKRPNKKKRRSNSKLPNTGERDGEDTEQNQAMEQ